MARITVKYLCGSKVISHGIVPGIITAITVRGKYKSYELSYLNNDGNLACAQCTEDELSCNDAQPIGFCKDSK